MKNFKAHLLFAVLSLLPSVSYAKNRDWCIKGPRNLPCKGARGKCTVNQNGSKGGFVASTARVEKISSLYGLISRNRPTIGRYAEVCEEAQVLDDARVYGYAVIEGSAVIFENARVYDQAFVAGNARISGNAQVYGGAEVFDSAQISGDAKVFGSAQVFGASQVYGQARIMGLVQVFDDARVFGLAQLFGSTWAYGSTQVSTSRGQTEEHPTRRGGTPEQKAAASKRLENELAILEGLAPKLSELRVEEEVCLRTLEEIRERKDAVKDPLEKCSVCLDSLVDHEELDVTPCGHFFCTACFERISDQCPNCRRAPIKDDSFRVKTEPIIGKEEL